MKSKKICDTVGEEEMSFFDEGKDPLINIREVIKRIRDFLILSTEHHKIVSIWDRTSNLMFKIINNQHNMDKSNFNEIYIQLKLKMLNNLLNSN